MPVFRIECFVDDRHVATVLRAMSGYARNLNVQPVVEASVESVRRKSTTLKSRGLDSIAMFMEELKKRGLTEFQAREAKEIALAIGASPTSYLHFVRSAVNAGFVKKRKGKGNIKMVYIVQGDK